MVTAAQKLQTDIEAACPGIPVRAFDAVDSLAETAFRVLGAGEGGPLILSALRERAAEQNAAAARLALLPGADGAILHPLTLSVMAAAACAMAVERLTPRKTAIGWPADVLLEGRVLARPAVQAFAKSSPLRFAVRDHLRKRPPGGRSGRFGLAGRALSFPPRKAYGGDRQGFFRLFGRHWQGVYGVFRDRCTALERDVAYLLGGEERAGRVLGVDDDGALIVLNRRGAPERLLDAGAVLRFL